MIKNKLKSWLINICYIATLLFLVLNFRFSRVVGDSMNNTYYDGNILVCCELDIKLNRGDIVVFSKNNNKDHYLIKRVIGLSGDRVEIRNNRVYVNDNEIEEDYIKEQMFTYDGVWEVPDEYIFVLGDNRNNSLDSREPEVGFVNKESELYGKIILNLSRFGVNYDNLYVCTILFIVVVGLASIAAQIIANKYFSKGDKEDEEVKNSNDTINNDGSI